MNNIFSFGRFGKYFVYDLRRWIRSYGLTFMLLAGVPVLLYFFHVCFCLVFGFGWNTPSLDERCVIGIIAAIILCITYPAGVYGFISKKQTGSAFVQLPVSVTEKFVSMILNVAVVLPLAFAFIYFSLDALLCLVDHSCGGTLFASFKGLMQSISTMLFTSDAPIRISLFGIYVNFVINILLFLLGAVLFRKHRILYTILSLIGIQMAISMIAGMIVTFIGPLVDVESLACSLSGIMTDPDSLSMGITLFNVAVAVINTLELLVLGAAIFFRIKTIKH